MSNDEDLLKEFMGETRENVGRARDALARWERGEGGGEDATVVFRAVHTLSGTAGFFGFDRLGALAHDGEKMMAGWRDGKTAPTPATLALAGELLGAIERALAVVAASSGEGEEDFGALRARLLGAAGSS